MSLKDTAYKRIMLNEWEAKLAEIERLRIEWAEVCNDYGRACAEIKRLRVALKEIDAIRTASDWNGKRLDHAAEIARRALAEKT
jgi:hypothetical protein